MKTSIRPSGFVLAGGQSTSMGADKALLEIAGTPLLLRAVNLLKVHMDSVTVLGPPERYEIIEATKLPDSRPGKGPLGAILTGLEHLAGEWGIFLACDLPLVESRFIELLIHRTATCGPDAVVPRTTEGWQPLCAAYRRTSAQHFREALAKGETAIIGALSRLQVDVITPEDLALVDVDETVFVNLNRPEDLQRVSDLLRAREQ